MGSLWKATSTNARGPNGLIAVWWTAFLISSFSGLAVINTSGGFFANVAPSLDDGAMINILSVSVVGFLTRAIAALTLLRIFSILVSRRPDRATTEVFA